MIGFKDLDTVYNLTVCLEYSKLQYHSPPGLEKSNYKSKGAFLGETYSLDQN
jgi:hypothetical protein